MTSALMPFAGIAAPPKGFRGKPRADRYDPIIIGDTDYGRLIETQNALLKEFHYQPDVGEDTWERPSWEWVRLLTGWHWRLPGDCEDFAIESLHRAPWIPRRAKRLVQCWTERGTAHCVAAVDTLNLGTLVIDNRRPLAHWKTTQNVHGYRFEKGITQVPGRLAWAWNIRAPTLADLIGGQT